MDTLAMVTAEQLKTDIPEFGSGDNLDVHIRVIEGDKERIQIFKGLCIQRRGGGIKPFSQKGTGRARQGSTREPQMRGGGVTFGPHKRSYRQKVPLRSRRTALRCMLSDRLRSEALCVLESLTMDAPKTSRFAELVALVAPERRRTLFVTTEIERNVLLSARNIPKVEVKRAADVNALDVLNATRVILSRDAAAKLEERLS